MTSIILLPSLAGSIITCSLFSATITFLLTLTGLLYCAGKNIQPAIHNLAGAGTSCVLLTLSLCLKPLPLSTVTDAELFLLIAQSLFLIFMLWYQHRNELQRAKPTGITNQQTGSRRIFESALRQHLQKPERPLDIHEIPNRVLSTLEILLPKTPALIVTYHEKQETINSSNKLLFAIFEKQLPTLKQDIRLVINNNEDKRINLIDGSDNTLWLLPLDIDSDSQTILILAPAASKDSTSYWHTACDVASHSRTLYHASRQSQHWQIQACLDPLTGVLNRRAFVQKADIYIHHRNNNERIYCSLLFIDIDNFKQINDQYGHPKGDLVLLNIAKICSQNIRQQDLLCRYGGEEFIVLLPRTNPWQAWQVAERIRKAIENSVDTSNTTVSIGLSTLNKNTSTLPKLIQEADQALYKAKHLGKNQVITTESCNNFRLS
ncbi:MAG: GGDEF domain-containing protein [Candidatus Endonucleobacter bathymodioli]|uniref:diguanylate cyclase n=1 Tax=Candidatus Endonucleibacter bathymodioli TaxID=539814 RepID=A0AA90NJJ0_9GAMM|nr:GGDEF domain-containing protein [Candidatus Endonucleobacter bathymodioli]